MHKPFGLHPILKYQKKKEFTNAKGTTYSFTGTKIRLSDVDGGPRPAGRDRRFYFLMAATALTAASSRFSAAVMGRPLSVRILLASCTLVPDKRREENGYGGGRPDEAQPEGAQVVAGGRGYG